MHFVLHVIGDAADLVFRKAFFYKRLDDAIVMAFVKCEQDACFLVWLYILHRTQRHAVAHLSLWHGVGDPERIDETASSFKEVLDHVAMVGRAIADERLMRLCKCEDVLDRFRFHDDLLRRSGWLQGTSANRPSRQAANCRRGSS